MKTKGADALAIAPLVALLVCELGHNHQLEGARALEEELQAQALV